MIYVIVFQQNQCSVIFLQSRFRIWKHFVDCLVIFLFWQVVEDYNKQTEEIQQLTEFLEKKKNELDTYKQNISKVIAEIITFVSLCLY